MHVMLMYSRWACQTNKKPTRPPLCLPVLKPPIAGEWIESDQRPVSRSNFCSYQGIDSTRLNRPAAPKVLPWQQDGNGDHNVFMVPATWGLRSVLSGDRTLPRARRVWAKSLHTRQQQNTEEPWQNGGRERERKRKRAGNREMLIEMEDDNRKQRWRRVGTLEVNNSCWMVSEITVKKGEMVVLVQYWIETSKHKGQKIWGSRRKKYRMWLVGRSLLGWVGLPWEAWCCLTRWVVGWEINCTGNWSRLSGPQRDMALWPQARMDKWLDE